MSFIFFQLGLFLLCFALLWFMFLFVNFIISNSIWSVFEAHDISCGILHDLVILCGVFCLYTVSGKQDATNFCL